LDGSGDGHAHARQGGEWREAQEVQRSIERKGSTLVHHGHGPLAPFEPVAKAQTVDQGADLSVLRKDVVVVRLDRLAGDADGACQASNTGSRLDDSHRAAAAAELVGCAQPGHSRPNDDGIQSPAAHVPLYLALLSSSESMRPGITLGASSTAPSAMARQ
jgi:hypothetical protein